MLRKRILVLCVLIFSMTLIFQVRSYTMAKVENSTEISITSSDKALISMPQNLDLKIEKHITENITNELTDIGIQTTEHSVFTQFEFVNSNFIIKNNMNENIDVKVLMSKKYEGITLLNNSGYLAPGKELNNIQIDIDNEIKDIPNIIDVNIYAKWSGGSAIIENQIELNVVNMKPVINISETDSRTQVEKVSETITEEIISEDRIDVETENNTNDVNVTTDIIEEVTIENPEDINNLEHIEQEEISENVNQVVQEEVPESINQNEQNELPVEIEKRIFY